VRYVDTGSRKPDHALGTWLGEVLWGATPVVAARVQTGYFAAAAMGHLETTLQTLAHGGGHTRLLIGSNDGHTTRETVADLLRLVGPPRSGLQLGIVSFQSGLFHPKVFHFERADGSSTAYVGSANLTVRGVTSQNVEAAIILDTEQGDSPPVLADIADAIDAWFLEQRSGLYLVGVEADLDPLVAAQVLGVPPPPRVPRTVLPVRAAGGQRRRGHSLEQLVEVPTIQTPLTSRATFAPGANGQSSRGSRRVPSEIEILPGGSAAADMTVVKRWYKLLHRSDISRLGSRSHPQGAMTLTQGPKMKGHGQHPIDQETYFRHDFFADAPWEVQPDGKREVAEITVRIVVFGQSLGSYDLQLRHSPELVSNQGNRATLLHWRPELSEYLRGVRNHDGDVVTIEKLSDGSYRLTIAAQETGPFIA
jgi:hypothetical protein